MSLLSLLKFFLFFWRRISYGSCWVEFFPNLVFFFFFFFFFLYFFFFFFFFFKILNFLIFNRLLMNHWVLTCDSLNLWTIIPKIRNDIYILLCFYFFIFLFLFFLFYCFHLKKDLFLLRILPLYIYLFTIIYQKQSNIIGLIFKRLHCNWCNRIKKIVYTE